MSENALVRLSWSALALVAMLSPAHAQDAAMITEAPPNYISYQGTLFHADDPDVPYDGALTLEFRLYGQQTDAVEDAVWAERHLGVEVFGGMFNVYLGAGESIVGAAHAPLLDVFKDTSLWLGVKAGLDDEVLPRQRISSIPYVMATATANVATHGVPAGTIMMFAGAAAPEGWLLCDGGIYAKESYSALYAAVGGAWGETATTFTVPNLEGRVPVGSGFGINANTDTRSGATPNLHPRLFGSTFGTGTQALTVPELPPHRHNYNDKSGSGSAEVVAWWFDAANEGSFYDNPFTTGSAGGNAAHNNLQPVVHMHYIIKN